MASTSTTPTTADIAILVCYDVEFPEAARVLAEAGAQIIFVPSCTDERQGFLPRPLLRAGPRDRKSNLRGHGRDGG